MKKIKLIYRLLLALVLGIALGHTLHILSFNANFTNYTLIPIKLIATFNGIVSSFLSFVVPLLILSFITVGVSDLEKGATKLLVSTLIIAYTSTVSFSVLAYSVSSTILPLFLTKGVLYNLDNPKDFLVAPYLKIVMPPIMEVMSALVLAFIIGLGLTGFKKDNAMRNAFVSLQKIVENLLAKVIIPILPFHIGGLFANMTYNGKSFEIIKTLGIVFVVIIFLHCLSLIIQFSLAGAVVQKNPFTLLKNMLSAYSTAIGTQSSAATIPITLKATRKNGVAQDIADFVIPLCATIHLPGSVISLTTSAFAISYILNLDVSFMHMIGFIFMLAITMVAAPGVPGGAVMASIGLLQSSLNFDEAMLSLIIALHLAQDSFGTATNVTGDGAIAIVVNKIAGNKLEDAGTEDI